MDEYLTDSPSPYDFNTISSATTLPLLSSTLQETLRLAASSFSIRLVVERDGFVFPGSSQAIPPIPYHSRIICCATRLLDVEGDDDSAEWNGERFVGEEGRRKAAREVRAFGGGVSIVSRDELRCVGDCCSPFPPPVRRSSPRPCYAQGHLGDAVVRIRPHPSPR